MSALQNIDNLLTCLTAVSFFRKAQVSVRLLDAVTHDLTVAAVQTTDYVMERFAFLVVRFKILTVVTIMILVMCKTNCGFDRERRCSVFTDCSNSLIMWLQNMSHNLLHT